MFIQIATFAGSRPFPVGMLDIDRCRPLTPQDNEAIFESIMSPWTKRGLITVVRDTPIRNAEWSIKEWEGHGWVLIAYMKG